ncbi:SLC10 [Echinococcus multilocularis]|uniref:SLC10 n=1 Tax=Echinococcus multilocularis TaxID=6211 RepID=A0A087VX58_ECHMU|nr:SLC10 [Echinococcus multilocularis]
MVVIRRYLSLFLMGISLDAGNLPPLWAALKVRCCNSREFRGYFCGASDGSGGGCDNSDLALCSIPEGKIIFVCGWSVEEVDVLADYPPLPTEVKSQLEEIYASVVKAEVELSRANSLDLRRKLVLRHFGPFAAKAEEDGKVVLYDGVVTVLPPYLPSSCQGTNAMVLQKVQNALLQIDELN